MLNGLWLAMAMAEQQPTCPGKDLGSRILPSSTPGLDNEKTQHSRETKVGIWRTTRTCECSQAQNLSHGSFWEYSSGLLQRVTIWHLYVFETFICCKYPQHKTMIVALAPYWKNTFSALTRSWFDILLPCVRSLRPLSKYDRVHFPRAY